MEDLNTQARDILIENDRGGYTVPTARLYPYQWNWDSAFVALGFSMFDPDRAWRELELLIEGQWTDGMIPHILFRSNDPDYFPGPTIWQAHNGTMQTGGISQPPVLGSVVRTLLDAGNETDEDRAKALFPAVYKWHKWFHTARTPDGCPVVATVHPWETGRDNCPDWDLGLAEFEPDPDLEPYIRKDTQHIDASMRPSKRQYDQFLTIVKVGREFGWDQKRLTEEGPFQMADPGIHFILLRADRDLLFMAKRWGMRDEANTIEQWITQAEIGSEYLWNDNLGAYCARNIRTGEFSNGFSNASALCFYAGIESSDKRKSTLNHLQRIKSKVRFMLPSWDPDDTHYEPKRYWRGPVWPQMNLLVAQGLNEQGYTKQAEQIQASLKDCIEQSGFWECFDPETGEGCIGSDFSWTAACWLAWLSPAAN